MELLALALNHLDETTGKDEDGRLEGLHLAQEPGIAGDEDVLDEATLEFTGGVGGGGGDGLGAAHEAEGLAADAGGREDGVAPDVQHVIVEKLKRRKKYIC